jgi:hypothetical protein
MDVNEIRRMTMAERLQAMERLWDAVCHGATEPDSPDWHEGELARRKARIESGEAKFLTVQEAKTRLR